MVTFDEENKYLIWLERDLSTPNYPGPHQSCFRLMKMNMIGKNKPEVVIDVKNSYNPEIDDFAGLYMAKIGKKCIVAKNSIILTTIVNDTCIPVICNLLENTYQVLNKGGRHVTIHDSLFDPISNTATIVGCRSSPLQAPHIVIGKIDTEGSLKDKNTCSFHTIGNIVKLDGLNLDSDAYSWKTLHHNPNHVIKGTKHF